MRNLFDFATKELSQDAFLRWLFENWNCEDEDVRNTSRMLLIAFLNNIKGFSETIDNIESLWTKSQDHKADIVVCIKMKNNKEYGIIIEDKTETDEHDNQLKNYYESFTKDRWWSGESNNTKKKELVFIYYKTQLYDKTKINTNWHSYDIDDIYDFFASTNIDYKNFLLKQYVEHINKLYNDLHFVSSESPNKWNFLNWETYFNKEIHNLWNTGTRCSWIGRYHNTYVSYCFKLLLKKEVECHNNFVVLELFFRKGQNKINSTIHPCIDDIVKDNKLYSEWHARDNHKVEDEEWINGLRYIVANSNSKYYKSLNTKQCVATSISENDISIDQCIERIKEEIKIRLEDFYNIFKEVTSNYEG